MTGSVKSSMDSCPECREPFEDLPATPRICPHCGHQLMAFPDKLIKFGSPDYLSLQIREFQKKATEEMKAMESDQDGKEAVHKEKVLQSAFEHAHFKVLRFIADTCDREDFYGAAEDALLHFQTILQAKKIKRFEFKELVDIGIRIGKQAQIIDDYIKNQGVTAHDLTINTPSPGTDSSGGTVYKENGDN